MVREKLIWCKKARSSTLIEVLISMVFIITIFGIAMMILTNIIFSSPSLRHVQAEAVLNDCFYNIHSGNNNVSNFTIDNFIIKQEIIAYRFPNLSQIKLTAYDENQIEIAQLTRIIYIH